jgi:hypothetical protein
MYYCGQTSDILRQLRQNNDLPPTLHLNSSVNCAKNTLFTPPKGFGE